MPIDILKKAKTFLGVLFLLKIIFLFILLFSIFSVKSNDSAENSSLNHNYEKIEIKNINYEKVEEDFINIEKKNLTYNQKIEVLIKIVEIYFNSNNMPKAQEVIKKGLSMADKQIDIQKFNLYNAYILNRSDKVEDMEESIVKINEIIKILKNDNSKEANKIKFESALLKGDTYLYLNKGSEAIKAYNESENYKYNDLNIFDIKTSKLFLYQSLELFDLALMELKELEKQLGIVQLEKEEKLYYQEIIFKLAVYVYEEKKDFENSNKYALKYLDLAQEMSLTSKVNTYYMISSTYSNLKDFVNAEKYFDLADEILKNNTIEIDKKEKLYAQYAYYKNKGEYEVSLMILDEYEEIVGVEKISKLKYEIYKFKKDYINAEKYLNIHINYLYSQIEEQELERYIKNNEKRHVDNLNKDKEKLIIEAQQKELELKEHERKNKILTINNYLLISLSILSLLFLLVLSIFYKRYYNQSITDGLTKVYNKRYMNKKINKFDNIIVLDIDYFKKINDTYGHLAGDELLRQVANIIKKEVGNNGFTIRYGGEEFVILLNKKVNGYEIGDRIREIISNENFIFENNKIKITVSLGVSNNLNKADQLLYKAKNSGRNKILKEIEDYYV